MAQTSSTFLAGIIEGFYGQPWSQVERIELFERMSAWGLNTYLYAPKDDLNHRAVWREAYSDTDSERMAALIKACQAQGIRFIYGLSPGLDIRYHNERDSNHLKTRLQQMTGLGCRDFALLFDDIPDQMDPEDLRRWGSLAAAQSEVVNAMFRSLRETIPQSRVLFCPTPYCGRMAQRGLGGENYLATIGRELAPEIDVFWTGPEIISPEIPLDHIESLRVILRRKPLIWDNLHANDYDGRRFYCGPYSGRSPELRNSVSGLLSNPNNEFPLNFVPMRTLAEFVRCQHQWQPRAAYLSALQEWLPQFDTIRGSCTVADLVRFTDCYYLPHTEGAESQSLYELASHLVHCNQTDDRALARFRSEAVALRDFCIRLTELRHRSLFYALSRRAWELREELDLLLAYLARKFPAAGPAPVSDSQLPATFRGGFVARLQSLLVQQPDGTFRPS